MQMAVIEFARHVLGWEDANSSEFSETTKHPVIALMPDQVNVTEKGEGNTAASSRNTLPRNSYVNSLAGQSSSSDTPQVVRSGTRLA